MNKTEHKDLTKLRQDFDEFECKVELRLDNIERGQEKIITNELPHMQTKLDVLGAKISMLCKVVGWGIAILTIIFGVFAIITSGVLG